MTLVKTTYKINAVFRFSLLFLLLFCTSLRMMSQEEEKSSSDSTFLADSKKVIFKVNSTVITPEDRQRIIREMVPQLKALGPTGVVIGRSAASPEGSYDNNRLLAIGRREAIKEIFEQQGINTSRIRFDLAVEEYALLVELMRQCKDPDYRLVKAIVDSLDGDDIATKAALKAQYDGALFRRLTHEYFPELRSVRIMVCESYEVLELETLPGAPLPRYETEHPRYVPCPLHYEAPVIGVERREVLAVKTNLLEYGAYIPKYGWCPMPNVAIEYFPRHGHVTWAASLDFPWWVGNTTNHKYFELRNYTLEARYYARNSRKSYDAAGFPNGEAAYKGFYLSLYGNAFLYQIGCNEDDGWIGEGIGGGIGLGWTIPFGRKNQHWRLDIGATFGFFLSKYDPFVYGCPVEDIDDGKYYYDYVGPSSLFKKRQYNYTWFGPTRVSLSLSYDLLYRRNVKKGVSFKRREKGGVR